MKYHCPLCNKELKKGQYAGWVRWLIGPIFGQLLRPLVCDDHGVVDPETLAPEERNSAITLKYVGIAGGILVNVIVLYLIINYN